jgi:ADP-ribose pyrophosphatase YjhB (NUDIX family)
MSIPALVEKILEEFQRRGGKLEEEDWRAVASLVTGMISPFPCIPGPLFIPVMKLCVPASIETVCMRNDKVLLIKRYWFGKTAFHFPGSYIAPGETVTDTAHRIVLKELGSYVTVKSAKPFAPFINHWDSERFHDASNLVLCEIEGVPKEGEFFDPLKDFPDLIRPHQSYWNLVRRFLEGNP